MNPDVFCGMQIRADTRPATGSIPATSRHRCPLVRRLLLQLGAFGGFLLLAGPVGRLQPLMLFKRHAPRCTGGSECRGHRNPPAPTTFAPTTVIVEWLPWPTEELSEPLVDAGKIRMDAVALLAVHANHQRVGRHGDVNRHPLVDRNPTPAPFTYRPDAGPPSSRNSGQGFLPR